MTTTARLSLFAAGVALSFGAAFLIGATVGPDIVIEAAPTHGVSEGDGMGHDGS